MLEAQHETEFSNLGACNLSVQKFPTNGYDPVKTAVSTESVCTEVDTRVRKSVAHQQRRRALSLIFLCVLTPSNNLIFVEIP